MPFVRITQQYADGSATDVKVCSEYPDLLADLRAEAVQAWRDTCTDADTEPETKAGE